MFAGRVRFAERDARIAAAVAAGRPVTEVAAEVGLKVDTIHYICRKRGVSCRALRAPGQTPPAVSRIQQANARARALLRPVPSPVTSDRVYDGEETEFLRACEAYREGYAKKFLNATDYLFVLKQLGYRRGGGDRVYEYAVVTYAVFGADALNAMAADGWEFVQHVYNLENHNVVVWRRPRPCTDPVAP